MPKPKKGSKKVAESDDYDDDEDDIEQKLKELAVGESDDEAPPPPVKSKSKKKAKPATPAISAFAMLGDDSDSDKMEDDVNSDGNSSDIEEPKEDRTPTPPPVTTPVAPEKSNKKKAKKNKGKDKSADKLDEDDEFLLAQIEGVAQKKEAAEEEGQGENQVEESEAARKKREKKQRQKEKKEAELSGVAVGSAADAKPPGEDGEEEGEGSKKKGKKKKGKKTAASEEPVEDDKKKPKSKAIAAMKEALAKAKEEQERMDREEEEKQKKLEEAKRLREEEKQRKEEQRRKQREKDKERKKRLKEEGKLLTPAQKAARERAEQMLLARGIEVPKPGEKPVKKPYYGKPRKNKQQPSSEKTSAQKEDQPESKEVEVKVEAKEETPKVVEKEDVKESWDEDVKESWDMSDDEVTETKTEEKEGTKVVENGAEVIEKMEETVEGSEEDEESEGSGEDSSSEEDSDEESSEDDDLSPKERALIRIRKRQVVAEAKKSTDKLRAPVVCVLGHVDTGKTKILDKLRRTNVQDGEAGGITQQIGATNVPLEAIQKQTSFVKDFDQLDLKVPGLLIIDTPGHESFSNLRTRGSSLCDIAILVIDIMHGLEPQTIESIQLLKKGKTPFVVALNKIDRMYGWKSNPHQDVQTVIKKQSANTKSEFDERAASVITQLAEQGLNAAIFYDNTNPREYISMVPTSAHTGDGMGNLIALLCIYSQSYLANRVAVTDNLQCTVMEVKALPGLGTTVDVILVNGKLQNGDVVILPGTDGPIVTHIRELLMPEPMKELRVKSQFRHHKEVEAAQGVKIVGKEMDKVMAGLPMYVAKYQDEVEVYKDWITSALKSVLNAIKLSSTGVFVQASTLGSMEALLEYLRSVKVPYAGINIGPVHKKDVMKASVMVEHGEPQYATILAFDVKVERDANELADNLGVKIFTADIIYHLFDAFTSYQEELIERGRRENNHLKVFPCKLRILPQYIFNSRDPIIMGVSVEAGFLSNGTPICVPDKEFAMLGIVTSIEKENKTMERAQKGMEVCIKIENTPGQAPRLYGRHFDEKDILVSKISRESIDAVKKYWKKDMSKDDWKLIIELKKTFEIM
ncbi:EIF5B [Bugula neritina]|uniref:Eukaryotic translation initiation factor 5B n=1 Tax=Bugula neritina TaxID=10212 RepID=A0A7J7JR38_BUGNE|nr:EIF5B [Bugula neritina]